MANGDDREVVTQPIGDKEKRAAAHKAVRESLHGLFDSTARESTGDEGQKLVIKWARGQQRRQQDDRQKGRYSCVPITDLLS
jgi:tRNA pseudouridine13 synthase